MKQSNAWLLDFGEGRKAALGERELLHLITQPELYAVPLTPAHCSQVLFWQEQLLPVWDLSIWLDDSPKQRITNLAAVIGYQPHSNRPPSFGALLLAEPPERLLVGDEQFCELPDGLPWPDIASSCFRHGEQPVPILDLAVMFSSAVQAAKVANSSEKNAAVGD